MTSSSPTVSCLEDGRGPIERAGLSYLPRFISVTEGAALIDYFAGLMPIWEERHSDGEHRRHGEHQRRLTRPVYWLGAWQFACLGYYSEPHYRRDRCLRAEPFPGVMQEILGRLSGTLRAHDPTFPGPPNTCLINYYGRDTQEGEPPRDYARLRMHRDGELGPVVMFSVGQPGLLEFIDPRKSDTPELAIWTRHRSVSVISGPDFKDRLYHRISQVRHGREPAIETRLRGFETRRISVSFRHVPTELIADFDVLGGQAREQVRPYVEQLAEHSTHFATQLSRTDGSKFCET